jgi:hypothetical protein
MDLKIEAMEDDQELQDAILTLHHITMRTLTDTPRRKGIYLNYGKILILADIYNGLNPSTTIATIFFPIITLQFKNDNQKQPYLFPIEPSLLSPHHSSLTVNAHERLVIPNLLHLLSQIVPTTRGIKNFDTFIILIYIIIIGS